MKKCGIIVVMFVLGVLDLICITGDTHADFTRFKDKRIRKLKKDDFLIICGDFGFIWDDSSAEKKILKKIGKKKFRTLFVDGCHENYELLNKYPTEDFFGGKVHNITGNLYHLNRGEIYNLQGYNFFAFGGGKTKETDIRADSHTLFEEELPSDEELALGEENLEKMDWKVDYIITHEPPASIKEFMNFEVRQLSYMHYYFDKIKDKCKFKMWYFGKVHINKTIPAKYRCNFDDVTVLKNIEWDLEQKSLKKARKKKK